MKTTSPRVPNTLAILAFARRSNSVRPRLSRTQLFHCSQCYSARSSNARTPLLSASSRVRCVTRPLLSSPPSGCQLTTATCTVCLLLQTASLQAAPLAGAGKRFYTTGDNNKTSILVEVEDGPGAHETPSLCVVSSSWVGTLLTDEWHFCVRINRITAGDPQVLLEARREHDAHRVATGQRPQPELQLLH